MKNLILGITGGIAAYKALDILSELRSRGYNVRVIMTPNATKIISTHACEVLSGHSVLVDIWDNATNGSIEHIALARWADAILVAPTTYNTIGAIASGLANTMLTCVISAFSKPIFFALAMNEGMYRNPILQRNLTYLSECGYNIIDSDEGMLACGIYGKGKLKKPQDIVDIVEQKLISLSREGLLQGKRVLITAGRTEEPIDPVRYISNRSSGRMGFALAESCSQEGAEVVLITGKHSVMLPQVHHCVQVSTAEEMYNATMEYFNECDICIACAAVADYRVARYSKTKIKKGISSLTIELEENPDILAEIGRKKTKQFLVGFALETDDIISNAQEKMYKKSVDMIVANGHTALDSEYADIVICHRNGEVIPLEHSSKKELSHRIIEAIVEKL
ncbi:MAG: bifunctional phosphopantothenoylcysteine decarboxylase/phosphopantothenate--cysteine ligase CoaBC [Desulfovibrionaceae bacterium]|nr:bifunctional phosphopantothenoylcysteine decarboxylase/phosphopantothenate--cysteine ligase CoaBC [Desulfovibrionaceae bacterium]